MKYQFKVGDKGKTTTGISYEIISELVPPHKSQAFLVSLGGSVVPYWRDKEGRGHTGSVFGDLIPPTRTVYVNLYAAGSRRPFQSWSMSEGPEFAKARAAQEGGAIAIAVPVEIQG